MIAKKNYCVVVDDAQEENFIGGIVVPLGLSIIKNCQLVVDFGFDTYAHECGFSCGDRVVFEDDPENMVKIELNGTKFFFRKVSTALAIVSEVAGEWPHVDESPAKRKVGDEFSSLCAIGDKILIDRAEVRNYYISNGIIVPYKKREIGRCHHGVVVSITDETSKKTGIEKGMNVLYDYGAAFGHEQPFDVVKEDSVFAALSQSEVEYLENL